MSINFEPGKRIEQNFFTALEQGSDLNKLNKVKDDAKEVLRNDNNLTPDQSKYILNIINVVNEVIISKRMETTDAASPVHLFYQVTLNASQGNITTTQKKDDPVAALSNALETSQKIFDEIIRTKPAPKEMNIAKEILYDIAYYGGLSLLPEVGAMQKGNFEHLPATQTQNVLNDQHSAIVANPHAAFTEGRIYGDGNCGFAATNTTRKEVVDYLIAHAGDKEIRRTVAPEIVGWLKTIPVYLPSPAKEGMEKYWKANEERKETGHEDQEIRELAESEALFRHYIQTYYAQAKDYLVIPDPGTTGVLNVIADMKKMEVRVWKMDSADKNELQLHGAFGKPTDKENTINIIHRNLHFNKLLPTEKEFQDFSKHDVRAKVAFSPLVMY